MNFNFAVYAEGCIYPESTPNYPPVGKTIELLQQSGFDTLLVGLIHIVSDPATVGDIHFNNTPILVGGCYVGNTTWPTLIRTACDKNMLKRIGMSLGGGGVSDFATIASIYQGNGKSFSNTNLQRNFAALRATFPTVSFIDLDCEDDYDLPSFVAFGQMLAALGFGVTFCPYTNTSFWTGALAAMQQSNPGAVKWWNLQCYDGGAGNDPAQWADAIRAAIPGFDTNDFILAGDWTNDQPSGVESLMTTFKGESSVGGGFIWTLDNIINQAPSDPETQMRSYVDAISVGLGNVLQAGSRNPLGISGADRASR